MSHLGQEMQDVFRKAIHVGKRRWQLGRWRSSETFQDSLRLEGV